MDEQGVPVSKVDVSFEADPRLYSRTVCDALVELNIAQVGRDLPVTCGRQTHGLGSVASRVQLTNNTPDDRCPGRGISGNKETCKDNHGRASPRSVLRCDAIQ